MTRRCPHLPLRRWAIALALTAVAAAPAVGAAQPFSSLTFFGDSFTDTGNGDILAAIFLPSDPTPSPPYAPGVISNGPIWAQLFAARLGRPGDASPSLAPSPFTGRNFAIGTARTGLTGGFGAQPLGLTSQLGAYVAGGVPTPSGGLYTIFGGGNDVFDAALLGTAADRSAAVATAVNNLATIATTLYGLGARQFLMPNVANVGQFPAGLASPSPALLGALSDEFNTLLAARLGALSAALPGSTFYGLSLDVLFENVRRDARNGGARYGITNVTVPCFPPPYGVGLPSCDASAFVDPLHPTTRAHALIADAAFRRVVLGADVVSIPEPSTVALLAGGLAILACGARSRRRPR